jgi:hypothetical protein
MARGRKKKAEFEDLDQGFKDEAAAMSDDQIKVRLAAIAIAQHELSVAKKADADLEAKRQEYQVAGEIYREGTKHNKMRTAYLYQILEGRGKV